VTTKETALVPSGGTIGPGGGGEAREPASIGPPVLLVVLLVLLLVLLVLLLLVLLLLVVGLHLHALHVPSPKQIRVLVQEGVPQGCCCPGKHSCAGEPPLPTFTVPPHEAPAAVPIIIKSPPSKTSRWRMKPPSF